MFNFFKKRKTNHSQKFSNIHTDQVNPSDVFTLLGPALKSLWDEFIKGQNYATEVFEKYNQYKHELDEKYADIDFNVILTHLNNGNDSLPLTVGEVMYLKLLRIRDDIHLARETNTSNPFQLSASAYKEILSKLGAQEIAYCNEINSYISKNIKPLIEAVSIRRFGINICESVLPFNTQECINYHRYLATGELFKNINNNNKWNRISNAPLFNYTVTSENPLIPISIKYINVFILDYLCYATISLPSFDLDRVLQSKDKHSGKTIAQILVDTFGNGIDKYIERVIVDMNCFAFRTYVRNGLKIK